MTVWRSCSSKGEIKPAKEKHFGCGIRWEKRVAEANLDVGSQWVSREQKC